MVEELHNPWAKKQFLGFARTSEFNGPRMPCGPHYLIKEKDTQPMLQLTYRIFGSSPPMRSFDPAKMLTDSGKLQTLDILLKRLRAEDHRVLLFAQMTKMLNIIEDYMNYRKYKYLRLDGSSNINDCRDMVRDFQHRSDIFVFLLSTRAGGLGINLTAADTVIFYESDWNPTLDLQAMDRAHRLGQTKEVTVYRLICKDTVEEKILQRASQKNTVQQLVMTGGNVQGDLMKPEDVFSLIMDDAQLEKMREIPLLAKARQKKKQPSKGIRIDADGVVIGRPRKSCLTSHKVQIMNLPSSKM
ncbi:DNA helicase INO80-like [Iris pallida]|uniref:Chromatin-remodeling ATPase INO80 n=1 Tax=Iris pallida TaxID=29817 RepID=A0AAX6I3A9_IRIPA|nr:DNA helicase INO80-like [Iris pallida]